MRKPATMQDVATRARVSLATVSNVLNGRKSVDPTLVERVLTAARDLDYAIDRAAARLRQGRARVVGIVVPSLDNPFFTSLIAAVERHARADDYDVIVSSANEDEAVERARLAAILSWRPAGVVVVPCSDHFAARDLLDRTATPAVILDRLADDLPLDCVTADNEQAGRLAAAHLAALGHDRVLVVASSLALANIRARCRGIAAVFGPACQVLEVGLDFDAVATSLGRHLQQQGRPSAVIALTNFATLGVLASCADRGIELPGAVSLVGFDDYAWMSAGRPRITAVRQPVDAMGAESWACLKARLDGASHPPRRVELACSLEIRQSTGPMTVAPIETTRRASRRRKADSG